MDEDQATYQSSEPAEAVEQETYTEAAEPAATQEAPAPEGFTVKYNKEERFVAKDEAPTWIQKGLNYDKVQERAQQLEAQNKYLERQARISGYGTVDEYMVALDEYEKNQQIEREAQRMGVDPETYAQYFAPVNTELQELRQKLQGFEQQQTDAQRKQQETASWQELYTAHPDLVESSQSFNEGKAPEWFNSEMKELIDMGYKPVHAYQLANKDVLFRQKEQEVLANVTGRGAKQILPSNDRPNNVQFDPAHMTDEQIQDLSARARRGERITFN